MFLDALVGECMFARFSEQEAIAHIAARSKGTIKITGRHYRRLKNERGGEEALDAWGSYMARIGFAAAKKDMLDEVDLLTTDARRQYLEEMSRPEKATKGKRAQRPGILLNLRYQLIELNKRREELLYNAKAMLQYKAHLDQWIAKAKSNQQSGQ